MSNDPVIVFRRGGGSGSGILTDENVKVSDDDTTADHLDDKIVAGSGIALTVLNDGLNEQLSISATGIANDDEEVILDFSYTDVFPLDIYTFSDAGTISACRIVIETAFDGTGNLSVGHAGFPENIMMEMEVDQTIVASFEVTNNLDLPVTTTVQLYSDIAGATQGNGTVILRITR